MRGSNLGLNEELPAKFPKNVDPLEDYCDFTCKCVIRGTHFQLLADAENLSKINDGGSESKWLDSDADAS